MSKASNPFGTNVFSTASGFGSLAISPISHIGEPLDLSTIRDPSIQIIFKNLSKKEHENTKVKALEELSDVIEDTQERGVDEGVLSAWVSVPSAKRKVPVAKPHSCNYTPDCLWTSRGECASLPTPYTAPSARQTRRKSQGLCPRLLGHGFVGHMIMTEPCRRLPENLSLKHSGLKNSRRCARPTIQIS